MLRKTAYLFIAFMVLILTIVYMFGGYDQLHFDMPLLQSAYEVLRVLFRVNIVWIGLVIFLENKNPSRTVAWLLVLVLLPVLGFFLYILFGRSYRKQRKAEAKILSDSDRMEKAADIQSNLLELIELPSNQTDANRRLVQLLLKNAKAPFSMKNKVTVLTNGFSKFNRLFTAIERASDHIHLEYFIIKNDRVGNELRELLIKKAREGVKVRVIIDDVGSMSLGNKYIKSLTNAGIEVYSFFKVALPIFSRDLNYRNHRKIVVIDGVIGFVGGLNVGDEYIGYSSKFEFWRDTHLEIKGEAVYALQTIFLNDWNYVSKQVVQGERYYPHVEVKETSMVQIAASGPDSEWKCILQAFYKMIANATEKVWITTPYLVPEESILMGLKTAALSGVDVRIIIPSQPDHFFVYWASQANIQQLLEAGVKIYRYKTGFIHSKIMIVDESVATVGTANLDIRSMEINFEVNAFIYDENVIARLDDDFIKDLEDSIAYDIETYRKRGVVRKILEAAGRLVSPLQ